MKHKTNLRMIEDFLEQIDSDYNYYDVVCINTHVPYCPILKLSRAVAVDVLRGFLISISKNYIIWHISISSTCNSDIVMILK